MIYFIEKYDIMSNCGRKGDVMKNVLEWLEASVKKYDTNTVFIDTERQITFGELSKNAKAIGSAIVKQIQDVSYIKRPIAVISGRNVLTPAAYLGVVYSGRAYAPLDAKLPTVRLQKILHTLQPEAILVDNENASVVQEILQGQEELSHIIVLSIEELCEQPCDEEVLQNIREDMVKTDPLYIIFTSGSTGNPKGVITSHESLMCYINAYSKVMGITSEDRFGNQAPLDYIAAIRDIYLPLKHGASTFIIPKEYFMEPTNLFDSLNQYGVTAVGWSVSALTVPASLGAFDESSLTTLKKICFSGSVMPCKYLKIWQEHLPEALFVNQYGPTEATASCTYYVVQDKVNEDDVLPIGKPYENYKVFLLTEDGKEPEQGEEGEICVSGPILALGYYHDRERTNESFIQNPLNAFYNEMIYKTGDIGVFAQDGNLLFKGRKDRQIKHMGHRVELDEVEYAANQIQGVEECCCIYKKEKEALFLFYSGNAEKREVVLELRKVLPGFMVPRKVNKLEVLPKLANGKIDMAQLKEM